MRRIAATLAVVVALLFGAGATLADDTSEANELFVEAVKLVKSAEGEKSFEKTLSLMEEALARVNKIIDDYPSSDLAVKLISGQNIGAISLKGTTPWHMHHARLTNYPAIPGRFDRVVNSDAR